LSSTIVEFLD